jgi:hypothetical protein
MDHTMKGWGRPVGEAASTEPVFASRWVVAAGLAAAMAWPCAGRAGNADAAAGPTPGPSLARGFDAGVELHADARLEDIGLPLYPGAVAQPRKGDEPAGFNFGFHLGSYGWRIHVREYRSDQPVELVAAYYLHALKVYGPVLDCARAPAASASPPAAAASGAKRPLACDDDETPAHGHLVYKVGTRADHRVVSLRRTSGGTDFELMRVEDAVGGDD